MIYTVDSSVDEPIMLINSHIGYDSEDGMGVDGALFQQELLQLDNMGKKRIQIWINSPGGVITDGYNICSAILKSKTPVDTYNVGMAASMACAIFLMGRKRYMADYAVLMMHPPLGSDDKKIFDALMGSVITMLSAKSSLDEKKVKYLVERTTWLDSSDSLNMGFCTDIEMTSTQNQKWMPTTDTADMKAMWKEQSVFVNNLLKPQNNNVMPAYSKLMNKMELNAEATEDSAMAAWDKMQNRAFEAEKTIASEKEKSHQDLMKVTNKAKVDLDASKAETEAAKAEGVKLTTELTTVKNSLTAKEKEFTDMKAANDALVKEKDDALAAEKKTKAETFVNSHAKTGRIKNDAAIIAKWVDKAIADFDGTKELIEAIPLNTNAPKMTEVNIPKREGIADPTTVPANTNLYAVKNRLRRDGKHAEAAAL